MRLSDDEYFVFIAVSRLPARLVEILYRNGVKRLSMLNKMNDGEILLLRNIGPRSLACIRTHKTWFNRFPVGFGQRGFKSLPHRRMIPEAPGYSADIEIALTCHHEPPIIPN